MPLARRNQLYDWARTRRGLVVEIARDAVPRPRPVPLDPYAGVVAFDGPGDHRRGIVKEYVNAIINDRDGTYWMSPDKIKALGISRTELDRRVRRLHAGIAHHFHTDAGLRMQFVDSQIAEGVMLNLMERGIVVLPIHDSFIVQAPFVGDLKREMETVFRQVTGTDAKLKAEEPALVRHYADPVVSREEMADTEVLFMHLDFECQRMSMANEYLFSWVQQNWTVMDLTRAFAEVDAAPASMLRHHAFPLRLLRPDVDEEEGKEGPRRRGSTAV